jgi:hypothetical protein
VLFIFLINKSGRLASRYKHAGSVGCFLIYGPRFPLVVRHATVKAASSGEGNRGITVTLYSFPNFAFSAWTITFGKRIGSRGPVIPQSRYLPPASLTPGADASAPVSASAGPGARLLARCRRPPPGGAGSPLAAFLKNRHFLDKRVNLPFTVCSGGGEWASRRLCRASRSKSVINH